MLRKLVIIFVFPILLSANNAFAYSEKTTHPALTNQILDFSGGLSAEERAWVVEGSQLEDTPPRWINHFYDPVNNTGWTGSGAGSIPPEVLNSIVSIGAGDKPLSALDWVKGCNTQSAYYANGGNRTWDKALDYYVQGNTKETYITLGYILHIAEDMGVPDHTRDDTHAQDLGGDTGSPYEQYTAKYDPQTIKQLKITEGLNEGGLSAPKLNSLQEYLVAMAKYSNKYFFSKDTINNPKYSEPKVVWDDGDMAYGKDENGNEFPLAKVDVKKENGVINKNYVIKNTASSFPILDAYFIRLSRQIVLNGTGIVQLFKKQAEDAKTNSEFFVDSQHTMAKLSCATGDTLSLFNPMGIVSGIGNVLSSVFGQVASTLKSGVGFLAGLISPRSPNTETPTNPTQEPAENDPPPMDASADIATADDSEVDDLDGYSAPSGTTTIPVASPTTTVPRISFATTSIPSATTTPKIVRIATTTTINSPITHSGGGGNAASERSVVVDDIAEEDSDEEIATSTTANSTSTENVATTTEPMATSTEESATSSDSSAPALTSSTDHVLISEILFDADGTDTGKEFIELYNPTDSLKNLAGYSLRYKSENSTTTNSLAVIHAATSTEQPIIPPHGFLLFGFGHYDPINYSYLKADIERSASLPNGSDKIKITLLDPDDAEVDKLIYDKNSIPQSGYSLERMAWNGTCVSANASFLGNGCSSGETQFEPRQNPQPQNSLSLPEPREKPTTPVAPDGSPLVSYDSSTLAVSINWAASYDAQNSTSGISYMIYDISSSTPALIATTTSTGKTIKVPAVGKIYDYGLVAEDRDGLASATTTFSIEAPSFLDKIYFYQDPKATTTARYLIDIRYSDNRPLIPAVVGGSTNVWEAMVFYLNREPNPANSSLPGERDYPPKDPSGILKFPIFSFDSKNSPGFGGGLYGSSFVLPTEDGKMILDSGLSNATSSDYITAAYYNHVMNGGIGDFGAGSLVLAAIEANNIYLNEPPTELPPVAPQNLEVTFDSALVQLNLNWASSTDPDSEDSKIKYEINFSTSTELAGSIWQSVDKLLTGKIIVLFGNQYLVGVRAVDESGIASDATVQNWSFPPDFQPITPNLTATSTNGYFAFVPADTSTIKRVAVSDDGGIYGACSVNQSRVQINGHNYPLTSTEGSSPKQYIYEITSSTENIYAGVPISINWQGSYWSGNGISGLWPTWVNFGSQSPVKLHNYQSCQLPVAISTATLVGS